jgi:hypothetical protein
MPHRHCHDDPPGAVHQRLTQCHWLGTYRQPAHRGTKMQPGPYPPLLVAQSSCHCVPEGPVVLCYHSDGGLDQLMVGGIERLPDDLIA